MMVYSSAEAVELELSFLTEVRDRLKKVLRQTKQYENTYLNVDIRGGRRYYHIVIEHEGKRTRKYVGKAGNPTVQALHERAYAKLALGICEKNIKLLENYRENYRCLEPTEVLKLAGKAYREVPDSVYDVFNIVNRTAWLEKEERRKKFEGKYREENLKHFSSDGAGKRSKGEVIIANILLAMKACFIYEPVRYINGIKFHPDFIVYNENNGEEIIIEYMGMMYEPDYRMEALERLENYILAGYTLGKDLIVFMDNEDGNIDSFKIRRILEALLK